MATKYQTYVRAFRNRESIKEEIQAFKEEVMKPVWNEREVAKVNWFFNSRETDFNARDKMLELNVVINELQFELEKLENDLEYANKLLDLARDGYRIEQGLDENDKNSSWYYG